MKRLSKLVAAVAVAFLVPLAVGGTASAAFTCDVGYTGPNSQNMCVSEEQYSCSVENTNEVTITNATNQTAFSGTVSVGGNTNGGGSASGSVTNSSGTTFSIVITNSPEDPESNVCTATVVVPAVETPEVVNPPSGGTGAVQSLPVTSGASPLSVIALIAATLVAIAAISVCGVLAYRYVRTR